MLFDDYNLYQDNQENIDRIFCPEAGEAGHHFCGICPVHDEPRFVCGCPLWNRRGEE